MEFIQIRGASEDPLRKVDLDLPLGELICLLGPDGGGSRQLALQVLCAESRRRYAQVLSAFERETLGGGSAAAVGQVRGLPPALYLDGRLRQRQSVAGLLQVAGRLSRWWLEKGKCSCPECGGGCRAATPEEAADAAIAFFAGEPCLVLAPLDLRPALQEELRRAGFLRIRLGGEIRRLDSEGLAEGPGEVVVDRVSADVAHRSRLVEACRQARAVARGRSLFAAQGKGALWLNQQLSCLQCGRQFPHWGAEEVGFGALPPVQVVFGGWDLRELPGKQVDQVLALLGKAEGSEALCRPLAQVQALGLGHLPLGRPVERLSTGEQQVLQLAWCLGLGLTGILHIFEAPSRGLDAQFQAALARGLRRLVERGNTAVVLDHAEALVQAAGQLFACEAGQVRQLSAWQAPAPAPHTRSAAAASRWLRVWEGGQEWRLPLGRLVCVCGPTGGGKSALLHQVLLAGLNRRGGAVQVEGRPGIQRVALLGPLEGGEKTLLALLGIFAGVASLYAQAAAAREQGYAKEWFMLDRPGGRCPTCEGAGVLRCDLEFGDDVSMGCPSCEGRRFRPEALGFTWRGLNLAQVLELRVGAAAHHFRGVPQVGEVLQAALGCGLGHRRLGEAADRLGAAEGLRLQLALELRRAGARELVVLEHPEQGGHPQDLQLLLGLLQQLREEGTSLLVETHHPVLFGAADWLVEVRQGRQLSSGPGAAA